MENKKKKDKGGGLLLAGSLFLGMGFGFLFNQLLFGIFGGLGIGFILMYVSEFILKK